MGKTITILALGLVLLAAVYLLAWPVPIDPARWQPPEPPSTTDGVHAANDRLRGIERLAEGFGAGPEAIAFDDEGRLLTGYDDGRVARMTPDGGDIEVLADTRGRPLGLKALPDGAVVVADSREGLLMASDDYVYTLSLSAEGTPYRFVDDVAVSADGRIAWFTDASSRFGYDEVMLAAFEHRPNGRLLAYDLEEGGVEVLADGLYFPNGVTAGPDDEYLLFNETMRYRVMRYWLKGERAGEVEVFADNLPGFPDNVTFNGEDRFWVALYAPRNPVLDKLLPRPFLRKVAARLPESLQPLPHPHAWVVALDLDGNVVADLQYRGDDAYAPITSAIERDGYLYLGSLTQPAIGRIALD